MLKQQEYILKKLVLATSAAEAIARDKDAPVLEVYCRNPDAMADYIKESKKLEPCIGFDKVEYTDD